MKKKMLSLLLASAIATTAMGLAACGDEHARKMRDLNSMVLANSDRVLICEDSFI